MEYQENGTGAGPTFREVTRKGRGMKVPAQKSQGEGVGAGSIYSAQLNQRPNISNPRNRGPERPASEAGMAEIPIVMQDRRNTGKL